MLIDDVQADGSLGIAPSSDHGAVGQTEEDGVQGTDIGVELGAVKHLPSHRQHTCKTPQSVTSYYETVLLL